MPVNRIEPAGYNGNVNAARQGTPFRISRNTQNPEGGNGGGRGTREQEGLPRGKNRRNNDEDVVQFVGGRRGSDRQEDKRGE
ncbi:hypothetical protein K0M31_018631 [Melipona bicolor]|uniref:Uncharacterized protein n=1 Tax=Melipona bicolor TaxID=60889 RepID=A0AA40G4E6_9HYME|nr:hypothetical protein K0M31_018631 [Melipona bicolor]